MTGSPRVLRDACSPLYPALMAEKQMQADAEKAKGGKSEKGEYKPLDLNADFVVHMDANDKPGKCAWKVVVVPLVLFLLIIKAVEDGWFSAVLAYLSGKSCSSLPHPNLVFHQESNVTDIRRHWGQYSPYHPAPPSLSPLIPRSCNVTFVQTLARHGSRFPTAGKGEKYSKLFSTTLSNVPESSFIGDYEFLRDYKYTLGSDELTITGRLEMMDFGVDFYNRYKELLIDDETAMPFVRSAGSERVVESATIFARALGSTWLDDLPPSTNPADFVFEVLAIPEGEDSNSTLSRGLCRNELLPENRKVGKHARNTFADHALRPVADRLNNDLKLSRDDKFTIKQTRYLMDMCPFEASAALQPYPPSNRTSDGVGLPPFCNLFTDDEWKDYSYVATLDKFYGYSQGNPLGPTAGIGFANELIARLTAKPVDDHSNTNHTLDSDPQTFPIGRGSDGRLARVFADFSHDNDITSIHAALGLYNSTGYADALFRLSERDGVDAQGLSKLLPVLRRQDPEDVLGYSAAWTVPFGSRTYIEGLACAGVDEMMVRILINDRVIDLRDHMCKGDDRWMCKLSDFVESLAWARNGGDWEKCFN